MQPIPHPNANVRLSHPDFPDKSRDLLVEKVVVHDDELPDDPPKPGIESAWQPDEAELRALVNGAPILLRIVGQHPPVALHVGDPDNIAPGSGVYIQPHVERALGWMYAWLKNHLAQGRPFPTEDRFAQTWIDALTATLDDLAEDLADIPDAPPANLGQDALRKDDDR